MKTVVLSPLNKFITLKALLFFFLLSGCSTTVEIPYLAKRKKFENKTVLSKKGAVEFESKDCGRIIFLVPIDLLDNPDNAVEKQCGEDWQIFDLVEKRSKFIIPVLYGEYCIERRGLCKK